MISGKQHRISCRNQRPTVAVDSGKQAAARQPGLRADGGTPLMREAAGLGLAAYRLLSSESDDILVAGDLQQLTVPIDDLSQATGFDGFLPESGLG